MLLARLSEAAGVSGEEREVRDLLREAVESHAERVVVDAMGNLIAARGRDRSGPRILLTAHMDEVGLMITRIDDDGLLRFAPVGGLDSRVLPGASLRVGREGLPGVVLSKPIHLQRGDERRRTTPPDELRIDIGARDRAEAERQVRPGDVAAFDTAFAALGRRVKGKAFDDRAGCAVLAEVFARSDAAAPLFAGFTVQEEVGLRGARVAAHLVRPDVAIALEATICADIPGNEPHAFTTRLGGGPAVTFADGASIPPARLVRRIVAAAERRGIAWQWRQTLGGATEAGAMALARDGVPAATVSVPCRYIHAPASLLDLDDFERTVELVCAVVEDLAEGGLDGA